NAQKQAQLMYDKRRKRRESHNAVERRRRDNINEKIQELSHLVPDCYGDPMASPSSSSTAISSSSSSSATTGSASAGTGTINAPAGMKANKGAILRKSVDYIRQLQSLVNQQTQRMRDLEEEVRRLRVAQSSTDGTGQ
ncbi:MAG: Myc-type, basic helix-loop-helix domain-containing protein, partial [Piptocephalis tieghemiana]